MDLLYRKNKIPIWIDIKVLKSNRNSTTFNLFCTGRYSDNEEELYYNDTGSGPFGIKGPTFPIGYKAGKKFSLKKNQFRKFILKIHFRIKKLCFKNSF